MSSSAMDMAPPLVSICIPTYNSARYIRETLDSIAAQTYKNVEVIISDNASSDNTLQILYEYAGRYGFKVLANETNIGALNNWNRLVEASRGEYVAIYHSDDVYNPNIVEESVRILKKYDDVAIVGTMAEIIDRDGELQGSYEFPACLRRPGDGIFSFDEVIVGILCTEGNTIFFTTPSLMVKRGVFIKSGPFDGRFHSAGDYEMWLRIATRHAVAIIDKKLMKYRVHENQGSEREVRQNIGIPDIVLVLQEYEKYIGSKRVRRLCNNYLQKKYLTVAVKQNRHRNYEKSSEALRLITSFKYSFLRQIIRMANALKVNLPKL